MSKRLLCVMLALLVAMAGVPFQQHHAGAAGQVIAENLIMAAEIRDEMPEYDTVTDSVYRHGNLIQNVRPDIGDFVAVIYDWELANGHGYEDGDTFTFELPDEFKIPNILTGNLFGDIGTYAVQTDGTVTFTFNSSINGGQGYEGIFYVWLQFDEGKLGNGLKHVIDFSAVGQTNITVHFQNNAQDGLVKSGTADRGGRNSSEITWTVDFNQGENTIVNAVLTDVIPPGLTLDKNSVEIRELLVNLDGSVVENTDVNNQVITLDPSAYDLTGSTNNQLKIEFLSPVEKAYRVVYKTSVAAPTTAPFDINYTNKAELTGNGFTTQTDEATVNIKFNEPLKKMVDQSKGYFGYEDTTQSVFWKIEYNYNQQFIPQADAWIVDTFDTDKFEVEYADIAVYEVELDAGGMPTGNKKPLALNTDYTVADHFENGDLKGFELQFSQDVNSKAYDIFYKMVRKAGKRVYGQETVNNTAVMHVGDPVTASKGVDQVIFAKRVSSEDFASKEIRWRLTINRDKKEMTDIVIEDDYLGMHMELIPGSFVVEEDGVQISTGNPGPFTLAVLDGKAPDDYTEGFKLLYNVPAQLDKSYTIYYKTKFDPTAGMPPGNKYTNKATISWNENGVPQKPILSQDSVTPQSYTINNGHKSGDYNARTKTITWTIDVNYNLFDIQDFILEDILTSPDNNYMEIVPGSLKIFDLNLQSQNNQFSVGDEWVDGDDWDRDHDLIVDNSNHKLTLKLDNIGSKALRIQYQTKLADEVGGNYKISGNYKNEAVLKDGENGPEIFRQQATVTPKHGGAYLYKSGQQAGNTDVAEWTITINPSQSYIAAGSVLTDTLSGDHILLPGSIKLYQVQVPSNNSGNLPQGAEVDSGSGDYELAVNGNTFTVTFNKALTTAYLLKYQTYINADNGDSIGNSAEFQGHGAAAVNTNENESFQVVLAGAGGGASSGKGKLKIVKRDDENKPLPGVTFELWNQSGTMLLETLVTDANGEAETKWLYKYHNTTGISYRLKEVSAPSGYLPDPDYGAAAGKEIKFQDPVVPFVITNAVIRQGFELIKRDKADTSVRLAGAEFELYDQNNGLVGTLTTGADGRIAMGDMAPGDYYLVETKAPQFYLPDNTPIPFTITANQTSIVQLTHDNQRGTDGKLSISKVDFDDNSPIAGVAFELRDEADNVVATGVTDVNGVLEFDHLVYGKYKLVETKADGYVIEQPERHVVIEGPFTHLTIENRAEVRDVKLVKYNANRSQTLPGAVFELWAWNGIIDLQTNQEIYEPVATIPAADLTTDANGELLLMNLTPNKYQLVEIQAPSGYKLDATPVEFEITADQTAAVIVEKTNTLLPVWYVPLLPAEQPPEEEEGPEEPGDDPVEKPGDDPGGHEDPSELVTPHGVPEEPDLPDEVTETLENTPKEGKVEVPQEGKAELGTPPQNGTVKVYEDGTWEYTPNEGFVGTDEFVIKIIGTDGREEKIRVSVNVMALPRGVTALPKTGEASPWPYVAGGFGLVLLGAVQLARSARRLETD